MLVPKQRAYLRKLAQTVTPIFQIGKGGISDSQLEQISNALEARELIKITLLNTLPSDKFTIAEELSKGTNSEIVHVIGNKVTLYRKSIKNPKIELP